MSIFASRRTLVSGGLMALFVGAIVVAAIWSPASKSTPSAVPLHGFMLNIRQHGIVKGEPPCPGSPIGVCSTFTANGSINGEGTVYVETFPAPPPPAVKRASDAHTVIQTKKGELRCSETAIFDFTPGSDHAFVDLCLITGGTGLYEGASGYIQEVGTFLFEAPPEDQVGELEYYGKLIFGS